MVQSLPPLLSVGVDIIEIERVARMVARYGDRFLARVYTPGEQVYCRGRAAELAARFAAKEAVSKALGTGLAYVATDGVAPCDVEIIGDERGKPLVRLHGYAQARAEELCLTEWAVSLSHSRKYAVAFVVASSGTDAAARGERPVRT